ncbi:OmpA family protein [Mesonia aestuariivivens]|uniref:OmpA family protein n=1 Tax=Mesonia aestuariivivens TaxID=2796128 RepID=A0ABS6VXJ4_9FLAO|nr:OmpA family protein [Mesonia aestuariivivens]MBW2960297.1 OmpA family protein [Mesonia aestuariivivens]
MRKTYYILSLLLLMGGSGLFAQSSSTKKADKYYDRLDYVKAIEKYEDLVSDGDGTAYIYHRLADAYYNIYNTSQAEYYYKMYIQEGENVEGSVYYRYAQMLKANQKFEDSNEAMKVFSSKSPNDQRAKAFEANPNYLPKLLNGEPRFTIKESSFNTSLSDFGGYEFGDHLYFVSARNKSRRDYGWNDQPTLDVYVASKEAGEYQNPKSLSGEVNSKFHEGTVSITPDGKTMYFTRNNYIDGDYEKSAEGIGKLKIYRASLVNGEWDDIKELPFNSDEYSNGHTALSPDGKTLYFSSDMPGGLGMSDLYKVSINEDGSFGEPENLGAGINTEGRESFPFIAADGTLYFSSDGQLGIGGLDVFYAKAKENGYSSVKNMGQPINSSGDDFAFTYNPSTEKGFVSSNRGVIEETVANDNIYEVTQIQPLEEIKIMTQVVDAESGSPISGATVVVYDAQENEVSKGMTTPAGKADFTLPGSVAYSIQVNAEDYESNMASVSQEEENEVAVLVELNPIEEIITEEEVVLNPIMFDFDKSNIRKQAAFELDKLVAVMKKYPEMKIKVRSHTDKRGSATYNQGLSERRAQSTVQYVVSQGIAERRISGEGFGESEPKVDCTSCSEEQFELNRRSEFKIVKK